MLSCLCITQEERPKCSPDITHKTYKVLYRGHKVQMKRQDPEKSCTLYCTLISLIQKNISKFIKLPAYLPDLCMSSHCCCCTKTRETFTQHLLIILSSSTPSSSHYVVTLHHSHRNTSSQTCWQHDNPIINVGNIMCKHHSPCYNVSEALKIKKYNFLVD